MRTVTFVQSTSILVHPHSGRHYSPYYRSSSVPQRPVQIASVETNVAVLIDYCMDLDNFLCLYMSHNDWKSIARVSGGAR